MKTPQQREWDNHLTWERRLARKAVKTRVELLPYVDVTHLSRKEFPALTSAVYFISVNNKVRYVGQSFNVQQRLCSNLHHLRSVLKGSRVYLLVESDRDRRCLLERLFIVLLKPTHNLVTDSAINKHLEKLLETAISWAANERRKDEVAA